MWPLVRYLYLLLIKRTNHRKSIRWTAFKAFWIASVNSWVVLCFLTWFLTSGYILFQRCSIRFRFVDKEGKGSVLCFSVLEKDVWHCLLWTCIVMLEQNLLIVLIIMKGNKLLTQAYFNITNWSEVSLYC